MLGKICDLKPRSLQLYGILGSQLVAKCLHFQQLTWPREEGVVTMMGHVYKTKCIIKKKPPANANLI
jgi:hypothetical protein